MSKAPLPENESERLATLKAYEILDTPPEPAIDDLTGLAALISRAKVAYVSLVDENRLWFKSKIGFDLKEMPRDHTFCGHTLLQNDVFTVADASADLRFCDHPIVTRPGGVRFYAGVPLRAPNGHNIGILCVMSPEPQELTESQRFGLAALARQVINQLDLRRKIDEILKAREAAVNAANFRAKFLANMSHEIRTPMSGVLGMSTLLLKTKLNPQQEDFANTIRDSASSLLEIINDILDISKIEAGQLRLENIDYDLGALLQATIKALGFTAEQKGLKLELAALPSIPEAIKGDPGRLRQVLMNIIGNAIKFTEKGGVSLRLTSGAAPAGQVSLKFEISDTGVGIPPEAGSRLFESFSQADASIARKFGGTGLGLAICKQLVERMGGEIGYSSEHGQGTTFWFTLTTSAGTLPLNAPPPEPSKPRPSLRPGPVQILVAEDNLINQKVIGGFLGSSSYHLTIVSDGTDAVEAAATIDYDLIFMDCHMPIMGGFEATGAIRKLPNQRARRVPIIALTADSMEGDRERCLEAGMDDYLAKPVSEKGLVAMIEHWLSHQDAAPVLKPAALPLPENSGFRFDEKKLGALRAIEETNGSYFVDDLIETFCRNAPLDLGFLHEAVRSNAYPEIHRLSHRLKASCAALGLLSLQENFAVLEAMGRTNSPTVDGEKILRSLESELALARGALGTRRSHGKKTA